VNPTSTSICENTTSCSAGQITQIFTITGGTAPYIVTASDPALTITPAGNVFIVDVVINSITTDTPVIVTVTDSATTPQTVAVVVTAINQNPPIVISLVSPPPATISCTAGGTFIFGVSGGLGPYTATSSNANVTTNPVPPTTFAATFDAIVAPGSCAVFPAASTSVSIVVADSTSTNASVNLTVTNP